MLNSGHMESVILPRWMSIAEAAQYCPIGEKRLVRLVRSGAIRGGRLDGDKRRTWFIDRESLDRYMEQQLLGQAGLEARAVEILRKVS